MLTQEEHKEIVAIEIVKEVYQELKGFIHKLNQCIDVYTEPSNPEHIGTYLSYEIGCERLTEDWVRSAAVVYHDQDGDFSVWDETETDQIRVSFCDPDLKQKLIESVKCTLEKGIKAGLESCDEWISEWEWEKRRFENAMKEFK